MVLLVKSMINGGKKKKGQSPSYSVKLGIEQNEKWVIELNFVLVTLKNIESLGWEKRSSSTTSTNNQAKNDCQTPGYQHTNFKSVLTPEIKFH